jgi:hypothetical protein
MSECVLRWTIGRSQSPSPQWSIYISEAEKIAQEIFHVEQVEFLDWEMTAGARARVRMVGRAAERFSISEAGREPEP